MTSMTVRPATQRKVVRWLHLLAAAFLGTFVYAPTSIAEPMRLLMQAVIVPAAVLTGLVLWKQGAIRRLTRRLRPDTPR